MILKEKVGEDEYVLDTSKLKDIEFPFYTPYNKSAYYVPSDKSEIGRASCRERV